MLRLDTTSASAEGAEFSPTAAFTLQAKQAAGGIASVTILARNHADADWQELGRWVPHVTPFITLQKMPFVKLSLGRNIAGQQFRVWDDAPDA